MAFLSSTHLEYKTNYNYRAIKKASILSLIVTLSPVKATPHNTQLPQETVAYFVCCFGSRNLFILACQLNVTQPLLHQARNRYHQF